MSKTCRDFERLCQELLDDRLGLDSPRAEALETHAAECEPCRAVWNGFVRLHRLLNLGLRPVPPASAEFLERLKSAASEEFARPTILPFAVVRHAAWWTAAAVLVAVGLTVWNRNPVTPIEQVVANRPVAPKPSLNEALALATSATLDLAREASAPAARVGRDVLDLPTAPLAPSAPELSIAVDVGPPAEALGSFRQKVNDGVRPISGSARQAFGFLLGPTLASRSQANPG